jgi:hypothetical protein
MFMGVNQNPSAVYNFLLSVGAVSGADTAKNTVDAVGGTSAIIVDNETMTGQHHVFRARNKGANAFRRSKTNAHSFCG